MTTPELLDVPVSGGTLRVARWEGDDPLVVAVHGITASHRAWSRVADAVAGAVTLVAPDLRGRGRSADLPGPYGMAAHAEDLMAILDYLDAERAIFVGHSMGGFVSVATADRYPERVAALMLVDGGIQLAGVPEGADIDEVIEAIIGPAMTRLRMTFPSQEAYRDFWRAHPAFADNWDPHIEAYVDYDLVGDAPELHCPVPLQAVREDSADILLDGKLHTAPQRLRCPTMFLRSPLGLLNNPPGLYPDDLTLPKLATLPHIRHELVEGTNHYTLTMGLAGAAVVANRIQQLVSTTVGEMPRPLG